MAAPNAAPPINNPQPRLPPEVCERIIDHLDPNRWSGNISRWTLLNCALVCRGWYAESRAVLFDEPILSTRKEAIACASSLARIPLLGARVRRLQIRFSAPDVTGPEFASILVMLAGKFPNLASLSFFNVSFEQCPIRNLAFWSLHEFSHVTSLELFGVTLPSAIPFFQVICSFPRLQHLQCHDLRWSEPRSMALLPERRRMPLTTLTFLYYDLSCFEDLGHILLSLLDQAMLEKLILQPHVSAPALAFTQDTLNLAGRGLRMAAIAFREPEEDADGNLQSLPLHPISFEANVNLQTLQLIIKTEGINEVALFVRSVLLPMLESISSKGLKDIRFLIDCWKRKWRTDAMLDAFDPEVCIQIDELLAEGHFPKLRDVSIAFGIWLDDSQHVGFRTEICARFPKLFDKNMLTINHF